MPTDNAGSAERVRAAFLAQAGHCARLGSPLTARVCELLGRGLERGTVAADAVLDWAGDPDPRADSLPLRVAGALHALVRRGAAPELAAHCPPRAAGDDAPLLAALRGTLAAHGPEIVRFIASAPQTNEVGRSTLLVAALLELARQFGRPIALREIGASAGLNLIADRYRHRFGAATWGPAAAGVELAPAWDGPPPHVDAPLRIRDRRGCDLTPVDLRHAEARERLLAYVWPDQSERLARLEAAIAAALPEPPQVDRADAADWVEREFAAPLAGAVLVLWHSITWNYLTADTQQRIAARMRSAGARATPDAPVARVSFELPTGAGSDAILELETWPGGARQGLAEAHPHGTQIRWQVSGPRSG